MGSFSFLKWFNQTVALLALVLIGGSAAFECHQCNWTMVSDPCPRVECNATIVLQSNLTSDLGTEFACLSGFSEDNKKHKTCAAALLMDDFAGGRDNCEDVMGSEYQLRFWKMQYKIHKAIEPGFALTEEQFFEKAKYQQATTPVEERIDPDKKFRVCSCTQDSCNGADVDKKNIEYLALWAADKTSRNKDGGKKKDNSSTDSSSTATTTTSLVDSGNLVAVIFLALAALVSG